MNTELEIPAELSADDMLRRNRFRQSVLDQRIAAAAAPILERVIAGLDQNLKDSFVKHELQDCVSYGNTWARQEEDIEDGISDFIKAAVYKRYQSPPRSFSVHIEIDVRSGTYGGFLVKVDLTWPTPMEKQRLAREV